MICKGCYIIFFILLLGSNKLAAQQDLTGTWEGVMGKQFFPRNDGQLLQVNIVQLNDKICGYTFDSVIDRLKDNCKALFEGTYDKKHDTWILTGTSFIENSGDHLLMRIRLWREKHTGAEKLEAEVGIKSSMDLALSMDNIYNVQNAQPFFATRERFGDPDVPEFLQLKRVSVKVPQMPAGIPSCFPKTKNQKDSLSNINIAKNTLPEKPRDTINKKPDSTANIVYARPVVIANDTPGILQNMVSRKKITFSNLPVDVKNITLKVYDNAIVDGDTVTIFYNNRLLVNKQLISEKPIVINIELDEKETHHEIILFADNLGSIPPNTALIVVTAGDKRYEIHSSASLEENAVLLFEYKPK